MNSSINKNEMKKYIVTSNLKRQSTDFVNESMFHIFFAVFGLMLKNSDLSKVQSNKENHTLQIVL